MRGLFIPLGIALVGLSQRMLILLQDSSNLISGAFAQVQDVALFNVKVQPSFVFGVAIAIGTRYIPQDHEGIDIALNYNDFRQRVFPLTKYGRRAARAPDWIMSPASTVSSRHDYLPGLLGRPHSDIAQEVLEFIKNRKQVMEPIIPLAGSGAHTGTMTATPMAVWSLDLPLDSEPTFSEYFKTIHLKMVISVVDINDLIGLPLGIRYLIHLLADIKFAVILSALTFFGLTAEQYRIPGSVFDYTWPLLMFVDSLSHVIVWSFLYDGAVWELGLGIQWLLSLAQNRLVRSFSLAMFIFLRSFLPYCVISPFVLGTFFVRTGSRMHTRLSIASLVVFFLWVFILVLYCVLVC